MKSLFYIAVLTGMLTGIDISVNAQTNVNLEKLEKQSNTNLKFIDDIELVPDETGISVTKSTHSSSKTILPVSGIETTSGSSIEHCNALQFKYALMTDAEVESIQNFKLFYFIEDWWGTRYRYGGSAKTGIDCSSFSSKLMLDVFGVNLPRTAREQFGMIQKVSSENLKQGDLVFFNTRGGVSHVGVYLANNHFVHSSVHDGVTISSLTEPYYSNRFIGGGNVVNVAETISTGE